MRLLLIRHGQTIDNVRGELGTTLPGPELTALGHRQASAIPDALSSEPLDAIYVSTMQRTHLTAAPLAHSRGIAPVQLEGLQEISAGDLEGRSDTEATSTYMRTIFAWWSDLGARIPGGEDGHGFYGRYTGAIEAIAATHGPRSTVAVFSHGAAIRAWSSYASDNIDADFSRGHHLDNTAVVVLEGSPADGWVTTYWAGQPLGGAPLDDTLAPDPTGDAA